MVTTTPKELLTVALQDLREGRREVAGRLPDVALATSDSKTRSAFDRLSTRASDEMGTLAGFLREPVGEPNLWAGGIMDDASRDVASTAEGPVRDIALIGAIRKFLAADIVSLETAVALAEREDDRQMSDALQTLRQHASDLDHVLRERLVPLTKR